MKVGAARCAMLHLTMHADKEARRHICECHVAPAYDSAHAQEGLEPAAVTVGGRSRSAELSAKIWRRGHRRHQARPMTAVSASSAPAKCRPHIIGVSRASTTMTCWSASSLRPASIMAARIYFSPLRRPTAGHGKSAGIGKYSSITVTPT